MPSRPSSLIHCPSLRRHRPCNAGEPTGYEHSHPHTAFLARRVRGLLSRDPAGRPMCFPAARALSSPAFVLSLILRLSSSATTVARTTHSTRAVQARAERATCTRRVSAAAARHGLSAGRSRDRSSCDLLHSELLRVAFVTAVRASPQRATIRVPVRSEPYRQQLPAGHCGLASWALPPSTNRHCFLHSADTRRTSTHHQPSATTENSHRGDMASLAVGQVRLLGRMGLLGRQFLGDFFHFSRI